MRISPILPAIIARDETEFTKKLRAIERIAPLIHIDAMDGEFVSNTTWADPLVVNHIATPARFEVHLMVEEPFRDVILWGKLASVRRIIVHAESTKHLRELLHTIRTTGKEVGLAINPSTPLSTVLPFMHDARLPHPDAVRARDDGKLSNVDAVLVLANVPGQYGRPFLPSTLRRIATLRKKFPSLPIGVDIGVNVETAPRIRAAGATFASVGSAILGQPNPAAAYSALVRAFAHEEL